MTRDAVEARCEALRLAQLSPGADDLSRAPRRLRVEPSGRAGVRAWLPGGCSGWGQTEEAALAELMRVAEAEAERVAGRLRKEAQRAREAARRAPVLDAQAEAIEAVMRGRL